MDPGIAVKAVANHSQSSLEHFLYTGSVSGVVHSLCVLCMYLIDSELRATVVECGDGQHGSPFESA